MKSKTEKKFYILNFYDRYRNMVAQFSLDTDFTHTFFAQI